MKLMSGAVVGMLHNAHGHARAEANKVGWEIPGYQETHMRSVILLLLPPDAGGGPAVGTSAGAVGGGSGDAALHTESLCRWNDAVCGTRVVWLYSCITHYYYYYCTTAWQATDSNPQQHSSSTRNSHTTFDLGFDEQQRDCLFRNPACCSGVTTFECCSPEPSMDQETINYLIF